MHDYRVVDTNYESINKEENRKYSFMCGFSPWRATAKFNITTPKRFIRKIRIQI